MPNDDATFKMQQNLQFLQKKPKFDKSEIIITKVKQLTPAIVKIAKIQNK